MNIHQVGADLFHAARQTDRKTDVTKLILTFRKCANAPKNTHIATGARAAYEASLIFRLTVMYVTRGNTARPQNNVKVTT